MYFLCKRPACYHSASTTHVRDRIFKLSPIHASVIIIFPEFSKFSESWLSKSSMVTRGITHLATSTLPVLVIQNEFSLLPLGRYLLVITTLNRYQPRESHGRFFFTTSSRKVAFVRYRMPLVTILPLDLVMIHWIRWIHGKSFREISITSPVPFLGNKDTIQVSKRWWSWECFIPTLKHRVLSF